MSDVRTFRAATMQDALDLVRNELGSDAVILHTREITHRRLLPFRRPRREIEITAGLEVSVGPKSKPKRSAATGAPSPPKPLANDRLSSAANVTRAGRPSRRLDLASEPSQTLAELLRHVEPNDGENPPQKAQPLARPSRTAPSPAPSSDGPDSLQTSRFGSRGARRRALLNRPAQPQTAGLSQTSPQFETADHAVRFAAKLDAIHKMIESLGRSAHLGHVDEIPAELFQLYTELIDAEVEETLARDLVSRLKQRGTAKQLADPVAGKALLAGQLQAEIRCCGPIAPRRGSTKVVALVGATGVGKTTTIAKLAANFRLRDGVRMGLVTVDTYRVAAVEQLRTYAEIIDIPVKVVTNPAEMRRALDEMAGLDLVLIDTAGRSPCDDLQVQELKTLLAEARVDEVHLVLSATSNVRHLEATAKKFLIANATAVILTKLDEAAGLGTLLSIARRVPLPISYVTTGQGVPEDIEPARPDRLARLVLGLDKLGV